MSFTFRSSLFALCLPLVVLAGCDCAGPAPIDRCETSGDCRSGFSCIDLRCVQGSDSGAPDGGADAQGPDAPGMCSGADRACGTACCEETEICATNLACCAREDLCGSTCCGAGEVCEGAVCRIACGASARCEDAAGTAVCCAAGEVCASSQCFAPTTPCADFIDCPEGQYCETTLGRCLPQPGGEECASHPSGGAIVPTLLWAWNGTGAVLPEWNQVMMAPMVANLDDDNADGVIDENDIPDVVFGTFCGVAGPCSVGNYRYDGVLRAVSGADGSSVFDVTDPTMRINPGGQVAIGDLDDDGLVEIVACESRSTAPVGLGQLIAFHHDGTLFWRSSDARVQCAEAAPAIADLDGDGRPEVFVRYTVVNGEDGSVAWHHDCVGTGGWATDAHNPCDYTTAADLDGDHRLEVVGGNVAYHGDTGDVLWDRSADFLDGYPAIGDLDRDGDPEVIVMHSAFTPAPYAGEHFLRALNGADGSDVWGPIDVNQGHAPAADVTTGAIGGGGPPTIGNFDDDPLPEIALAGAYAFAVFEPDGTARWTAPTQDHSSRKTGSSVFDFDGDGVAEAVYNDEYWLRVYDGRDGEVLFCECNTSATLWEYPVIVDVDNDAHAEIILASNDYGAAFRTCADTPELGVCEDERLAAGANLGTHGIRVFASPTRDWVATRRIWNQHTYHVTNVTESGGIPAVEGDNWSTRGLNNFRQNVQPGASNVPDLVPTDLAVDLTMCSARMTLNFRVTNEGWAASAAGVPVTVYVEEGGAFVRIGRVVTTRALLPGESEPLSIAYDLAGRLPSETIRFRVVINDATDTPDPELLECRPANNQAKTTASCSILI